MLTIRLLDSIDTDEATQLGLSNYSTAAVKEWLDLCDEKGYVKPTVYQGQYNALQRHSELALYPLLKKHGVKIAVYR